MRLSRLLVFGLLIVSPLAARADDWPQWGGPKRDCVWRETGILDKFPDGGPKALWRTPIGAGYAGPAVADGRVYVTDRLLADGAQNPKSAFDRKTIVKGVERVLCLDEKTGKEIWKHEYACPYQVSYPAGPRCTPTVDGGKVYTLGTMGDLICFNAKNGEVIWKHNFPKEYDAIVPQWGFAASPLIDGDRLICLAGGSDNRMVMAFDKNTGKVIWTSQPTTKDFGYCPPVIFNVGKMRQLIIWHSSAVVGLEPETGKRLWRQPFEVAAALTAPMPRLADGNLLFVTSFYNGSMLMKLDTDKPGVSVVWKSKSKGGQSAVMPQNTTDLHSIMPTPWIQNDYIYGVCSYGEFRCLELKTGKRIWETHQPTTGKSTRWGNAFIIPQGDRFFLFNELGELIIAKLSPEGYKEIDRAKILEPTNKMPGRPVVWSHPAFADKCMFVRNDKEIVCVSLAK